MTKLTILIATMNNAIASLIPKISTIPSYINIIICHQITNNSSKNQNFKKLIENIRPNIKVIQKYERGLSKSRNCAISNVKEGICIITDDDVWFPCGFDKKIIEAYQKYQDADIITFQAITPQGEYFKLYKTNSFSHTQRSISKVSSIEITFRINSINKYGLKYDERFGLGSKFPTSEEFIFLSDALKKGLRAIYCPFPIAIHSKESSGGNFTNNDILIKAKGATFYRVFGFVGLLAILLFTIKKYKLSNYTFSKFLMFMLNGAKEYKKTVILPKTNPSQK